MENNVSESTPTTSAEETTSVVEESVTPATPSAEETTSETTTEAPLRVKFKHKERDLSHQEAVDYAQKGLKYDEISPVFDKLAYLASIKGMSAQELVDEHLSEIFDAYKDDLIDRYGEDDEAVEMLYDRYVNETKSKYEKIQKDVASAEEAAYNAANQSIESRLADEFAELVTMVDGISDISEIPASVIEAAVNGKNLTDAYLRYLHADMRKSDAAKQTAANNAKNSAGTMSYTDEGDSVYEAFMKGLRS